MSFRAPVRLWVATLAALAGCTVPSLAELESQRARSCDDQHGCSSGYACVDGTCRSSAGFECVPGGSTPCGSDAGECLPGSRPCGSDGKFGACVGGVGPVTEVCNGKDDDCNGQVDDGVQGPVCALAVGVCAGKRAVCNQGALDQPCGSASYGSDYEAVETKCD